jgi:hypothetical protein
MTRLICIVMALFAMSPNLLALEQEVANLKSVLSKDRETINQALLQLNTAIKKYEMVDSSTVDNPSPERQQRRHDIMAALGPIEPELVRLLQGDDHTLASNAGVILGNSSGGPVVYDGLKHVLAESKDASLPAIALSALYQTGRADSEVRNLAAERIAAYKERSGYDAAFGLLRASEYRALPEALPVCIEMLKSDAPAGNKMVAVGALMKLGPAAAAALPELQRFLAQLRTQGGDFRDVNTVERAKRIVSGQAAIQTLPVPPAATPAPSTPVPTATPAPSIPAVTVAESPAPVVERKAPVWPWLVGILALIVIVALALKRRA